MSLVKCQICGKEINVKPSHLKKGWGKYCSIKCRAESQFNGKKVRCFECGKEIYRSAAKLKRSKSSKYFCTKSCQTLWRNSYFIEDKHPNWKFGEKSYRKILLRSNREKKCIACGIDDIRALVVHHKDSNRKNNKLNNLVWLCLNCHYLCHQGDVKMQNMVAVA